MTTNFSDESSPLLDVHVLPADGRADVRAEPNYRALAVGWVAAATVIRLVCVGPLPLGNGEAYYYTWSRFLDWSYYDHPPLVAWMVRLTTLFGSSPAAVRLGPILAAGAFGLLFYRLAERLFRPRAAFFALVLVTALPVFLGSSFVLNPEAPLAPLWVGFLLRARGDAPARRLVAAAPRGAPPRLRVPGQVHGGAPRARGAHLRPVVGAHAPVAAAAVVLRGWPRGAGR